MTLSIRQRERLGGRGDEAHESFAGPHGGQVDGFAVEAFGGKKLEHAVAAHHIERAHLRHHVGGDENHDLVETILRSDRLRHNLAEAAQQ